MTLILSCLLLFCVACQCFNPPGPPMPIYPHEIPPAYWEKEARAKFEAAGKLFPQLKSTTKPAKNVIIFLGDGMGLQTVAASRFYYAAIDKKPGHAIANAVEDWDFNTECRTYDLETMVTDSASSATAYLTGESQRVYSNCFGEQMKLPH